MNSQSHNFFDCSFVSNHIIKFLIIMMLLFGISRLVFADSVQVTAKQPATVQTATLSQSGKDMFVITAPQNTARDFQPVVKQIQQIGDQLLKDYQPADGLPTLDGFSKLYFDHYEASGMEVAVAAISPTTNIKTETLFAQLIGGASKGLSKSELQKIWTQLKVQLHTDLQLVHIKHNNPLWSTFLQSFSILLREGFEALLIVTALIAYLRREQQQTKEKVIYWGVAIAGLASLFTAFLFVTLFKNLGQHREAIEGITMLCASAVMFYVSYWLFAKRESIKWQKYIKNQVAKSLSTRNTWALGLTAFLAVFREGAETILFYQALILSQPQQLWGILLGFIIASFALVVIYKIMQSATVMIPYNLFFTITAIFLYYMSFSFIGHGILELQEAGLVNITPMSHFPQITWLGIFPIWQNVIGQLIFLVPSLFFLAWWLLRKPKASIANG